MITKTTYEYIFNAQNREETDEAMELKTELMNAHADYREIITPEHIYITVIENWRKAK